MNKLTSLTIAACLGFAGHAFAADNNAGMSKDAYKAAKDKIEAQYKPSPKADEKVKDAKADADYDVAKEKCEDQKGNAASACKKEAKAAHDSAKAQAKGDMKGQKEEAKKS